MLRSILLAPYARYASAILCVTAALMVSAGQAQQPKGPSKLPLPKADPAPQRIVTQGPSEARSQCVSDDEDENENGDPKDKQAKDKDKDDDE